MKTQVKWFYNSSLLNKCDMGLLPDRQNCGLRMRRAYLECFPCHQWVGDPDMHDARAVMHAGIAN